MGKEPTGYFAEPKTVQWTEPTLTNKKSEHRHNVEGIWCLCGELVDFTMRRLYRT